MIRLYDNKVVVFLLGNPVHISLCLQSRQRKKKKLQKLEALVQQKPRKHSSVFSLFSTPEQTKDQVWLVMPNESVLLESNLNTCPCLKRYKNVFGDWEQNYQLHSSTLA